MHHVTSLTFGLYERWGSMVENARPVPDPRIAMMMIIGIASEIIEKKMETTCHMREGA